MAHKKGMGSSSNGRDSHSQRLGIKRFAGQFVLAGSILVRQRGTKFFPGANVKRAKDDTLFATASGHVRFETFGPGKQRIAVIAEAVAVAAPAVVAPETPQAEPPAAV